jgi:hypothetical protein
MKKQWHLMRDVPWQVLIILDALRPDIFGEVVAEMGLRGEACRCDSQALDTRLWYRRHWTGRHPDTVLISAHPYPWHEEINVARGFADAVPVWLFDENIGPGGVVHPDRLVQIALWELGQRPDMRAVIHFVQPHLPYVDRLGFAFLQDELGLQMTSEGWLYANKSVYDAVQAWGRTHGWYRLRGFYKLSLMHTVKALAPLLYGLKDRRIVITGDHAELIGEANVYGHPRPAGPQLLCQVPWFEVA